MKIPSAAQAGIGLLILGAAGAAQSAELKVLCANGAQAVMDDVRPAFERATGHTLALSFGSGGATVSRAQKGEPADVVIAPAGGIDALVKSGRVAADGVVALASTGISVAVREGAPRPDISSEAALRQALLAAKSITYLDPAEGAASGIHFAKVLERLGIAQEVKSKTRLATKAGAVGAAVASGDAEIGVIQYQLLFSVPGIQVVGPLPGDLQDTTVFSAAVMEGAAAASRELVRFMRSPEALAAIRRQGMEPL